MKHKSIRLLSVILAVLMAAGVFSAMTFTSSATAEDTTDTVEGNLILHCWSWNFNNIKANLEAIHDAGYAAIQTSPINAVYEGEYGGMELYGDGKWYYQYQPTGFSIGNYQLGTEEEFKAMCEEAHKYGIKVIVDVVANHTTGYKSAVSDELKNIEGGLYHNYQSSVVSRRRVTQQYDGMPDVNTQNENYQNMVLDYLKRAIADGADGFRYDTAKHIELPDDEDEDGFFGGNFWPTVLDNGSEFQYGEVLQGGSTAENNAARFSDYAEIMHVTASAYGGKIREFIKNGTASASALSQYGAERVTGDRLVTWVESHDTYANSGDVNSATSFWIDNAAIRRGWALIAATGDTTSLFFARPEGSEATYDTDIYNPARWGTNKIGNAGDENYFHPDVVAVNKFHNDLAGEPFEMSNLNRLKQAIIITRSDKGAVLINNSTADIEVKHSVELLDGTYTDSAAGVQFTVEDGTLKGTLKAGAVAVICNTDSSLYDEALPTEPTTEATEPETTEPETTEPTEITEPSDSTGSVEPTEPTETTKPPVVTDPTEPANTTNPTTPSNTSISVKAAKTKIYVGGTTTVTATVKNAVGTTSFKSSNTSVATVNSKGKVTAKKAGTVKITATNNKKSATVTITVKNPTVKISKTKIKVKKTAKITTKNTSGKVTYSSDKKKIAKVSKKGVVTGLKKGTAKITVKCKNYKKTFKVKVVK